MLSSRKTQNSRSSKMMVTITMLAGLIGCAKANFGPAQEPDTILVNPDNSVSEKIIVSEAKPLTPVDILFVIDNSRSMREEQAKLSSRLEKFVNVLGNVDWQIGMTTTDMSDDSFATKGKLVDIESQTSFLGQNKKVLNRFSPNYKKSFADSINKYGTPQDCSDTGENCPSGYEQPMKAIYQSIVRRNSDNRGFYRNNADLAVIIISDEDEESETEDLMTPFVLSAFMKSQLGENKRMNVYGIIHQPGDQKCLEDDFAGARFGFEIANLTRMTDGFSVSICEPDYAKPLIQIGQRVVQSNYTFQLKKKPKKSSLKVVLTPQQPNISWKVEGNKVILSDWPSQGSQINVNYETEIEAETKD